VKFGYIYIFAIFKKNIVHELVIGQKMTEIISRTVLYPNLIDLFLYK